MNRVQNLIRRHGGTVKVARDAKLKSPSTVSTWIKQRAIPFKHWQHFVRLGVSWEELLDLHKDSDAETDEESEVAA